MAAVDDPVREMKLALVPDDSVLPSIDDAVLPIASSRAGEALAVVMIEDAEPVLPVGTKIGDAGAGVAAEEE